MIKFEGIRNNRPVLRMDAETERVNQGRFPKWVIRALDDGRIRLDGATLHVGNKPLSVGQSFREPDAG